MGTTENSPSKFAYRFAVGLCSVIISILIFIGIGFVAYQVLKQNNKIPPIAKLFNVPGSALFPKPAERVLYVFGCCFFPVSIVFWTLKITHWNRFKEWRRLFSWFGIGVALFIGLICTFLGNQLELSSILDFNAVFRRPLTFFFWFGTFLWFFSSSYCTIWFSEKVQKRVFKFLFILVLIYAFFSAGLRIFGDSDGYIRSFHFSPVFSSVVEVFQGKVVLTDFLNTYGLYPHFLHPLFAWVGLSPKKFSFVMAGLVFLSLIFFISFLNKAIKNRWLKICALFGIVEACTLYRSLPIADPYFQYVPIRIIFPSLLLYLSACYFEKSTWVRYYGTFCVLSFGVLWNLDVGLVCYFAWLGTLLFLELAGPNSFIGRSQDEFEDEPIGRLKFQKNNFKSTLFRCSRHVIVSIGMLFLGVGVYSGLIFSFYQKLPDFSRFGLIQRFVIECGFSMLSTPVFNAWNFYAIVCLVGIACSVFSILKKELSIQNKSVVISTLLSMGLFSYYQGRSATGNLIGPGYSTVILLCLFSDQLWDQVRSKNTEKKLSWVLFLLCFTPIATLVFHVPLYQWDLRHDVKIKWLTIQEEKSTSQYRELQELKRFVNPGEKSLVFSFASGAIHALTETPSAAFDSFNEIFLKTDYNQFKKVISDRVPRVIFVETTFWVLPDLRELHDIVVQNYHLESTDSFAGFVVYIRNSASNEKTRY